MFGDRAAQVTETLGHDLVDLGGGCFEFGHPPLDLLSLSVRRGELARQPGAKSLVAGHRQSASGVVAVDPFDGLCRLLLLPSDVVEAHDDRPSLDFHRLGDLLAGTVDRDDALLKAQQGDLIHVCSRQGRLVAVVLVADAGQAAVCLVGLAPCAAIGALALGRPRHHGVPAATAAQVAVGEHVVACGWSAAASAETPASFLPDPLRLLPEGEYDDRLVSAGHNVVALA